MSIKITAERKAELWSTAEQQVREALDAMPEPHRAHLSEIAQSWFTEDIAEIKLMRQRFNLADDFAEAGQYSSRFVYLNRKLFRDVSLFLLGVAPRRGSQ